MPTGRDALCDWDREVVISESVLKGGNVWYYVLAVGHGVWEKWLMCSYGA